MKISTEEITELAEKRYGTNPHSFGGQRDGFKEGFKQAQQLFLCGVSKRFSSAEKMAEWLHNNYEEIALNNGWKTQDDCQVPFLDLPKENKQTMIEVCERFLNVC